MHANRMECRRHQSPLPLPKVAIAGNQPVAHKARQAILPAGVGGSLNEALGLAHEEFVDDIGVGDHVIVVVADFEMPDVAISLHPA